MPDGEKQKVRRGIFDRRSGVDRRRERQRIYWPERRKEKERRDGSDRRKPPQSGRLVADPDRMADRVRDWLGRLSDQRR